MNVSMVDLDSYEESKTTIYPHNSQSVKPMQSSSDSQILHCDLQRKRTALIA